MPGRVSHDLVQWLQAGSCYELIVCSAKVRDTKREIFLCAELIAAEAGGAYTEN